MPFNDRDTATSGRNSRASDLSVQSRPPPHKNGHTQSDMFAAPGVLSMLRTTTDMGDVGGLSALHNRLPAMPRPTHRRRTNPSHLSDSSQHRYAPSQVSNRSSRNQPWETASMSRRGSVSSLQTTRTGPPYYSDGPFPSSMMKQARPVPYAPSPAPSSQDSRSYSMTQPIHPHGLVMQRSVSSLRSQGTAPLMPPRGPYMYPARLKRPGYRAASPALSDFSTGPPLQLPRQQGRHVHRPPLASYHSDYTSGPMYPTRPYPPPMSHAPPMSSHHPMPPMPPMPPMSSYHRPGPGPPMGHYEQDGNGYMMSPPRPPPGYPTFHYNGPPHPVMPPRAYTPRSEATPPSSGPNSSAAPSSNPPTPKDGNTAQITIEPAFVDPVFSELPDDSSDVGAYAGYVENLKSLEQAYELDATSPAIHELEAPMTSPVSRQQEGFVQRIKTLLNERAAGETAPTRSQSSSVQRKENMPQALSHNNVAELSAYPVEPLQRRSTTTRVSDAKYETLQARPSVRITKEMVRNAMAPSSSEQGTVTIEIHQNQAAEAPSEPARQTEANKVEMFEDAVEEIRPDTQADSRSDEQQPANIGTKQYASADGLHAEELAEASHVAVHSLTPTSGRLDTLKPEEQQVTILLAPPISPLRSSEGNVSDSAISPVDTQELRDHVLSQEIIVPANGDDIGTQSKSVVAPATTQILEIELPAPPTVKQPNESSVTSNIMTDIAVRFSLPRRSHHGKAQLVRVNSVTETAKPDQASKLHKEIFELPETVSPRESVINVEPIAPLQIKKSDEMLAKQNGPEGADLSSFIRRSFPRRQSIWPMDLNGSRRSSTEVTPENRLSTARNGTGHLPGLREDSQEDMPSAAIRTSDFKFPLPNSISAKIQNEPLRPLASCPPTSSPRDSRPPSQQPGMSLSDLKSLPSLNFSQMDLVDQLNTVLDNRSSKSLEVFRGLHRSLIISPSPLRPASTEALRERYTSFFAKPEEFHVPAPVEETESFSADNLLSGGDSEQPTEVIANNILRRGSGALSPVSIRPLSPEQLLNVASEANRLLVPSVAGLSERLSQIMPSLRHLHLDSIIANDEEVEHTIEEIHHIGERPQSMCTVRSSVGLRSLAAVAEDIATHGTHDSTTISFQARLNKHQPPVSHANTATPDTVVTDSKSIYSEEGSTTISEPTTPKPALLRTMSEGRASNSTQLRVPSAGLTCFSRRSLTISGQNSRPWIFDENYPWSNDTLDIGIGPPPTAHCRDSIASDVLRHTAKGSQATAMDNTLASLTSVSELDPTATVTADTLTNTNQRLKAAGNKKSKQATTPSSLLGSLKRKASRLRSPTSVRPSHDRDPDPESSVTELTLTPNRPHRPGDRYPSTALTAAFGYSLDEVRSYFSDDSEGRNTAWSGDSDNNNGEGGEASKKKKKQQQQQQDRERASKRGSIRKHLSSLRLKLPVLSTPTIMVSRPRSDIEAEAAAARGKTTATGTAATNLRSQSLDNATTGAGDRSRSHTRGRTRSRLSRMDTHDDGTESLPTPLTSSTGFDLDGDHAFLAAGAEDAYSGGGGTGSVGMGMGMGKVEFRVKRVTERIRLLWARGGELVRALSGKGRKDRERRGRGDESVDGDSRGESGEWDGVHEGVSEGVHDGVREGAYEGT